MYEKITLVGNLGGDPEMRYTPSGQAVTNFSLATNRTYTNSNGEKVKETTWWRISAWGRQAETTNQYLKRGSKVLVEGRMNADKETGGPRTFQRQDGSTGTSYELTAFNVLFMDSRADAQGQGGGGGGGGFNQNTPGAPYPEDDDIPF